MQHERAPRTRAGGDQIPERAPRQAPGLTDPLEADMSQITFTGNLGADPELRFTDAGVAVVRFSVGVSKRVRDDKSGEWKDGPVSWFDVTAWRHLAEHIAETCSKGMRVMVAGEMVQRSWQDDKSGERRFAWQVNAASVGVELTFATAKVTRSTRGVESAPDDPWATASRERPTQDAASER